LLGYPREFMPQLAGAVIESLVPGYPVLRTRLGDVQNALRTEESNFVRTLDRGSEMLDALISEAVTDCTMLLAGEDVFTLHDTFGFPLELTREIASERGVVVDTAAFDAKMNEQRLRARADTAAKRASVSVAELPNHKSEFTGYHGLESHGRILGILVDGRPVDAISAGSTAQVLLDRTSFYAEKGGQIGDRGTIVAGTARFEVADAQYAGEAILHHGTVRDGEFAVGDEVTTAVDPDWRAEIRRHHTSAHLLQRALKDVLGDDVAQAGSWVGFDRMRFDFRSPGGALRAEQRRAVAQRVNAFIREDFHLETRELPIDEALKTGAIVMTDEKYGELVRVVQAGPSVEFCGGTHAHSTGELGLFVLLAESSIGAGVRRIEAVVSRAAEAHVERTGEVVATLAEALATKPDDLIERVARIQCDLREVQKTVTELKGRLAAADAQTYVDRAETLGAVRVVMTVVPEADAAALRALAGAIRAKLGGGAIALVGVDGETVSLFASVSDDAVKAGVHAGNLVKAAAAAIGGKGGGAATQAQGGGRNVTGAEAALAAFRAALA
jgi:alanyl-tRNA synthetase